MNTDQTPQPDPSTGAAPQPAPAPVATAPRTPHRGRRAAWIAGGAVAGILLVGGATAVALVADRFDDDQVVVRSSTAGYAADATAGSSAGQDGTGQAGAGTQASTGAQGGTTGNQQGTTQNGAGAGVHVDPDDLELTGTVLEQASAAALAAAGEGVVTAAERSDDPTHTYEVEVTRQDGKEMDVYLDADFQVVANQSWHH